MAENKQSANSGAKNKTLARIKRTEAYAERVRLLFANCVNEILALKKTLPKLGDGVMYSFDGDTIKTQQKVDSLFRRLAAATTLAIKNGIKLEWAQANAETDDLIKTTFGNASLYDPRFRAYNRRNGDAMRAFTNRVDDGGFNLSERIWKTTQQLREEMEVAMTLGIGEGESAAEMSRKVRKYLNDPDLMFRRFKYKKSEKEVKDYDEDGNVIGTHIEVKYGLKWKKKVKDENGKTKWIDYDKDSYKVGSGNYKSSAKNAMRVTRTETNMAYRAADLERWKQLDFVLGIHIEPSKNHPTKDICDKLQGDYPKDFVFEGWHPQCFCVMTPILADEDEMAKKTDALLNGETYQPKGAKVNSYPDDFKDWVIAHQKDIETSHDNGRDAYFIRHNYGMVKAILNPKKPLTIKEKVEAKHNARTGEEIDSIKAKWEKRVKKNNLIKKTANNILKVAGDYGEVDYSALNKAISSGSIDKMMEATKAVAKQLVAMKKQENALSDIIPNVHEWHKKFTIAELKAVREGVINRLAQESFPTLEREEFFLTAEISWVKSHKKYSTWEVAASAYDARLSVVKTKIEIRDIGDKVADALAYAKTTRSKPLKALADTVSTMLKSPSVDVAQLKKVTGELDTKYKKLVVSKATKTAKVSVSGKTIADLKTELGANMPKTLPNLETAIAKYELSSKYGSEAKTHKKEIEAIMRKVFDTHDFGMNINDKLLDKVFTSWFKNQFETGTGEGTVYDIGKLGGPIPTSNGRLQAAHKMFGLSTDLTKQLERKEYEKYGSLLDHDILRSMGNNSASWYGNVEVRFKKDKIIATWTAGDSLSTRYQPSLVSDPKACSFDDMNNVPKSVSASVDNFIDFRNNYISSYLELQYHGDLTIECIESLTFPYDITTSSYASVAKKFKKLGVKIYYVDGGSLHEML